MAYLIQKEHMIQATSFLMLQNKCLCVNFCDKREQEYVPALN